MQNYTPENREKLPAPILITQKHPGQKLNWYLPLSYPSSFTKKSFGKQYPNPLLSSQDRLPSKQKAWSSPEKSQRKGGKDKKSYLDSFRTDFKPHAHVVIMNSLCVKLSLIPKNNKRFLRTHNWFSPRQMTEWPSPKERLKGGRGRMSL